MRKSFLFTILLGVCMVLSNCTRIDAGHEGIRVKQYGTDKGVQNVSLVTGRVWYNPWTEDIFELPTFVQTADYDPFSVNAKDGSIFEVDPIISFHIISGKTPEIFIKYRKSIEEIQESVLRNYVKDAFKNVFNEYTSDSILSKRQVFDNRVTTLLTQELEKEGFAVDQITFGLKYPQSITDAINAKNKSIQDAQRRENDLRTTEANNKILVSSAAAEAEANRLKQQTLTELLIRQQFIDKWDGRTPLYGNVPTFFKNVQ